MFVCRWSAMSDKSDHLIERAAALLRAAKAGHVVDSGILPDSASASERVGQRASTFGGNKPIPFVTAPIAIPYTPQPGRPANASEIRTGSVSELRQFSTQVPVGIAALERAGLMVARTNRTRTTEEYRIVIGRVLRSLHSSQDDAVLLGLEALAECRNGDKR